MIRKVLYDALAAGYSEYDAILFARVSARSGLHMTFSKSLCQAARIKGTKDFVYADGYYDPYGNRIVINPEGTRSVDALLIHELTHAVYKDKRGRIILERGAKNMSDEQKQSIINSYSKVAKGSSAVIMDEMNAHYIEGQLKNKNLLEALLSDEPTLKDKILSFFKGASTDYAGNAELSGAAKRLFKRYKKLFDSFSAQNQGTNAYGAAVMNSAESDTIRFALMNDKTLSDNVDDVMKMSEDEALQNVKEGNFVSIMKETPSVILENVKDAKNLEIIIRFDAFYLATRQTGAIEGHYHNYGEIMKKLPEIIANPEAIVRMDNNRLNLISELTHPKGNNNTVSVELNTVKDINSKYTKYNLVVSVFASKDNYVRNNLDKHGIKVEYQREDLSQVNPQLYKWLAIINDKSSTKSIPQKSDLSTDISEKNSSKRFALPEGVDIEDLSLYNEIQLPSLEYKRIQSEALVWDSNHRNEIRVRILSNGIAYKYVIDDDSNVHIYKKTIAKNIHERRNEYDNTNRKGSNRLAEELRVRQRDNRSNLDSSGDRRKQTENDRQALLNDIGREKTAERARNTSDRTGSYGRQKAGVQSPYLKVVHTFTDISGRRRNVIRVDGEFMIEGNDHARYSATIEDAVSSENKRIIDRYARKYNTTAGIVRRKLAADPDFLKSEWKKGKRFALPEGDAALEELLAERDALESVENSFDAKAIVSKGLPLPTGRENISRGELKKIIANNTADKVYSRSDAMRVVGRYARKYNTTAGIVRRKLVADPDFLKSEWKKGKRFALPEIDSEEAQKGYVSSSGTKINSKQAVLLEGLSNEQITVGTEISGKRDITFGAIGITDAKTKQAWIDAGLAYEVDGEDGSYYTIPDEFVFAERERRQKAQKTGKGVEIETVDDIIEGISQGSHEFNGYRAFINRDTGGIGATVTVKRPDGERIRQRIDNGRITFVKKILPHKYPTTY